MKPSTSLIIILIIASVIAFLLVSCATEHADGPDTPRKVDPVEGANFGP